MANRSEAIREGLWLLHRRARHAGLAHDYDEFYGDAAQAPVSEVAEVGDIVAAQIITDNESPR